MIVWDLDAASLADGPVTSWTGTSVSLSLTSDQAPVAAGGVLEFIGPGDTAPSILRGVVADLPVGGAVHLVAELIGSPDYVGPCVEWGQIGVFAGPGPAMGMWDALVPVTGLCVVTVSKATSGTRVYVNATLRTTSGSGASGGTELTVQNIAPGTVLRVHRVVGSDGDAVAVASALVTEYVAQSVPVTASATVAVSATADATTQDVWIPAEPAPVHPGGAVTPPEDPEPQDPPAKVKRSRIRRLSEVMPVPTLVEGRPVGWVPTSVVTEIVGRLQIIVEGVDITYWDGVETPHPTWSRVEPFGHEQAQIELPQVTTFSTPGSGDMAWCRPGANVCLRLVTASDKIVLWRGVVTEAGVREDSGVYTLGCVGLLFTADMQVRTPPFVTTPQDAGVAIARALNRVTSRRYRPLDAKVTGCKASVLGGWEHTLTGWVTQILATSIRGGRQWTVSCVDRQPVIELKDTTTVDWTIRAGQRGIEVDLTSDVMQSTNRVFAEGIRPDGGRWRNAKYPNWRDDDTPPYDGPMNTGMTVGWSSPGVRLWQEKAGQPVTGTLSQEDRVVWRRIQADAGIRVDDFLGPQTWAASFGTGSNTGTLDGAFIAPVAAVTEVRPDRLSPDGDVLGENPGYDRDVLPVDRYVNFGAGVTKTEGVRAAKEILARDANPGWAGRIAFTTDPNEGSRYLIREGHNIRVRGFQGQSLLTHVARVEYGPDQVVCTVDTNARDYPTLDAVLDRERAAVDPARAYRTQSTASSLASDRATWDAESPGGRVPKHALFGGLWNVLRIPFSQYGEIVRTVFTTSENPSAFALAVFDRPVQAVDLVSSVGNPLSATQNPWQEHADDLEAKGLLMAWGWAEQRCGYYPKDYQTPDGTKNPVVTGRFVDDASWTFASQNPPWLWVAMIANTSCQIEGRFYHGVS